MDVPLDLPLDVPLDVPLDLPLDVPLDLPLDLYLAILARLPLDDAASCAKAALTCKSAYAQWRALELAHLPEWTVRPTMAATDEPVPVLRLDADPPAAMRLVRALLVHRETPERLWSLIPVDASVARHMSINLRVHATSFRPYEWRLRHSGVLTRWRACLVGCQAVPDPEDVTVIMNVAFAEPLEQGSSLRGMSWSNWSDGTP